MDGRRVLAGALACVVFASCAGAPDEPAPESGGPAPAFSAQYEELCRPAFQKAQKMRNADSERKFGKAAKATARAERKLADALREVEAPPSSEDDLEAYIETLEEYSDAYSIVRKGRGPAPRRLDAAVDAAKTGIRLEGLWEGLGLPSVCPSGGDAHTTLFVARVNRDCFEIRRKLDRADVPTTLAEAIEILDVARGATADVALALRRSLPRKYSLRVQRIVTLGRHRFQTLERLREATSAGDLTAFEEAWPEMMTVRRRLARQMETVGLFECGEVFAHLGV